MNAEHMYYAAFSAALMAGAEPAFAQRIGYQMAYLSHHAEHRDLKSEFDKVSQSGVDELHVSDADCIGEPHVSEFIPTHNKPRPINPLSHVDWLKGGVLNQRGLNLTAFGRGHQHTPKRQSKIINVTKPKIAECERLEEKLNKAIQHGASETDPMDLNKFCIALSEFHQKWCAAENEAGYWLMMHAVHCFLWGAAFEWQRCDEALTALNRSNKPMFPVVEKLRQLIIEGESEPLLWQCLAEQICNLPIAQQNQCSILGVAYRPGLVDDYDLAYEPHRQLMLLHSMDDAKHWFETA
ncbi:hypothetical protein G5S52_00715 [Grimontia sp. S25]|uniref:Uncharacterized protein n=1 Tax=Grimontia sedimenti TaxID=2711294 RepID=A0A6M1R1Y6_9GAMM|nr:hypothetical protein [Grimontia sedimenti]NGN96225.1 hypothetical protein [Grimontia sedimenti]